MSAAPVQEAIAHLARMPLPTTSEQARQRFAAWQALANGSGTLLRPAPPEPTSCCGRGCNGCVWEGFYGATQFWIEDARIALEEATADAI